MSEKVYKLKFTFDREVKDGDEVIKYEKGKVYEIKGEASRDRWLQRGCVEVNEQLKEEKPQAKKTAKKSTKAKSKPKSEEKEETKKDQDESDKLE